MKVLDQGSETGSCTIRCHRGGGVTWRGQNTRDSEHLHPNYIISITYIYLLLSITFFIAFFRGSKQGMICLDKIARSFAA